MDLHTSLRPQFIRIPILAALTVAAISGVYLGLLVVWLALAGSLDAQEFELRRPLRQFFGISVALAAGAGLTGFVPLVRLARRKPGARQFLLTSGAIAVAAGLAGMLLFIPASSPLSEAGGLTPNFGHLLTYTNLTGALWLFLMTGFIPFAAGYAAGGKGQGLVPRILFILVVAVPLQYAIYAFWTWWERVTAS